MLAANLYESGKLTLGQAAELAGYSKHIFITLLADYNVSYFNINEQELELELEHAKGYNI